MDTGYIKLGNEAATIGRGPRMSADLACWSALVHAWDDIEAALGEAVAMPAFGMVDADERPAAAPAAKTALLTAPLTAMRPFD